MENEVTKLEKFLDKRFEERDQENHRQGLLYFNEKDIEEGLSTKITDFYCKNCKCDYEDWKVTPVVESDWTKEGKWLAYFKSKHKCGTWNRRKITDKHTDEYWTRSSKMRRDVGNHYKDMIQPNQSGFDMLYGYKQK